MSKFTILGIISCIGALILIIFQAISSVMGTEAVWKNLTLVDIFEPEFFAWTDKVSWFGIEKMLDFLIAMPLFLLLLCIGILSLIIGGLFTK
ncbi:MAG: hypothetical protein JW786_10855 [Desulfobacterales bacterium]|nr:hypothetical protein [Desulfobacterales bacterium]